LAAVGLVDTVVDDDVIGWIWNPDEPESSPRIAVRSDLGLWQEFRPHHYRPDVVSHVNAKGGKHGFAIPRTALPPYKETVEVCDQQGQPLENGKVQLREAWTPPNNSVPGNLFLHIQKTAGTAFRSVLSCLFSLGETCWVYPDPLHFVTMDEFAQLPLPQRSHFRLVMGHLFHSFGMHIPPPMRFSTVLRDPVERVKSHFWHHRIQSGRYHVSDGLRIPWYAVASEGLTDEFDNLQIRVIASASSSDIPLHGILRPALERAISNLDESFDFVGRSESALEDVQLLCRLYGRPAVSLRRENERRTTFTADELACFNKIDWKRVKARHEPEIELYEYVRKHQGQLIWAAIERAERRRREGRPS
jgi:hypothetical protein